jgi:uncharacterized membrane protein YgcG
MADSAAAPPADLAGPAARSAGAERSVLHVVSSIPCREGRSRRVSCRPCFLHFHPESIPRGSKLYVGNLNFTTTEDAIRAAFAANGRTVREVAIPSDRETGRPRGFAFVTMGSDADAKAAIAALDGKDLDGRTLRVNEAQDKPRTGGGGGGGGRGGFGGGGRGGGGGRERW